MDMTAKLVFSCLGAFITGMATYWFQTALDAPLNARFWISMFFSGAVPVATYFGGLSQRAPWAPPTLPVRTEETTATTSGPRQETTVVEKKVTVTDPPPKAGAP